MLRTGGLLQDPLAFQARGREPEVEVAACFAALDDFICAGVLDRDAFPPPRRDLAARVLRLHTELPCGHGDELCIPLPIGTENPALELPVHVEPQLVTRLIGPRHQEEPPPALAPGARKADPLPDDDGLLVASRSTCRLRTDRKRQLLVKAQ